MDTPAQDTDAHAPSRPPSLEETIAPTSHDPAAVVGGIVRAFWAEKGVPLPFLPYEDTGDRVCDELLIRLLDGHLRGWEREQVMGRVAFFRDWFDRAVALVRERQNRSLWHPRTP
jgi:hypothetical protein